jgi:2-polyprenyl-3-methyl-5-hydroxy-6-metoxy-1,4-benzoquinol methylase
MNITAQELDSHAQAYSKAFTHFDENVIVHIAYGQRIARQIKDSAARRVLSLGVGHMEVARPIVDLLRARQIERYVVVDAAPSIMEGFRASVAPVPKGLDLVQAFFESFEDQQQFDVIEAGFILEHVQDPGLILSRLQRFAAPGACLHVAVPNARSMHRMLGHHAGLLPDVFVLSDADRSLGHRRYFDVPSLTALALQCGWQVRRQAGLLLKPFTTGQLNRLNLSPPVWQALQTLAEGYPEISNAFCMELVACQ